MLQVLGEVTIIRAISNSLRQDGESKRADTTPQRYHHDGQWRNGEYQEPPAKSGLRPQAQIRAWLQSGFAVPRTLGPQQCGGGGVHYAIDDDSIMWTFMVHDREKMHLLQSLPKYTAYVKTYTYHLHEISFISSQSNKIKVNVPEQCESTINVR
ncbi:hypothetical protein TNCV_3596081 [Trichonephila clavipes]|nr:hypothetical protein TNCV_3596081 [Trichonephila clavipes]